VATATGPVERAAGPDLRGVTVLIVEDHDDSREMLSQIVESFGATVILAADGRAALRKVGWIRPNLVLCDLRMPGLDGFGFVDRLRHDPALSRIPVIAVSALGSDADVMRTWEAGFNGHLVKPIDYETIAAQLERVFWAHRPARK
jgi:two-component system CheB/CheR fusion protein